MKLIEKNANKKVTIDEKQEFLAAGGEGSVYLHNGICYKVYTDPAHMIPEVKIQELMEIKRDTIIAPLDILMFAPNKIIGYTMNYVDGYPLSRLFNIQFLTDNNIPAQALADLCDNAVASIQHVHDKNCLVVDHNEMNYMVDKVFKKVYLIDINAWQTKSFKPSAITPLFQDHSTKDFSVLTDWYGFGIVAFKLFIGIHPYKGTHPKYPRNNVGVIQRMKDGISALNKDVHLPDAARSFDHVPTAYMDWFKAIFEQSKRIPPPHVAGYVTVVKKVIEKKFQYFTTDLYKILQKEVRRYYKINGVDVVFHDDEIIVGLKSIPIKRKNVKIGVMISPIQKEPYFVFVHGGKLNIYDAMGKKNSLDLFAEDFIIDDHVIYVMANGKVLQIVCNDFGDVQVFAVGQTWDVTHKSTSALGNCFMVNLIGKIHFLVPIKIGDKLVMRIVRVAELDSYRVIEAKFDGNVLGVIGVKDGKYDRFMLMLDKIGVTYFLIKDEDIALPYLNFVVLDNGIGVSMDENAEVTIFTARHEKYQAKSIQDKSMRSSMRLFKDGVKTLFAEGNKVFSLSTAKIA